MAYTSVIPVHRLDRSIEYVKDKEKTTQKADSLEAAIDYAMNRTKTEQAVFEDTIGCTNENAYADMVATKKRFHKMGGVEGYHLVQSFAEGEVTPELAHLIGQELADRLLKGQYEVVITTHLSKNGADSSKEETDRDSGTVLFLFISNGGTAKKTEKESIRGQRGYPETGPED